MMPGHLSRCGALAALLIMVAAMPARAAEEPAAEPVAPGKFIPTFAIKYGGSSGWVKLEEAARFDLIVASAGAVQSKPHPSIPGDTWRVLKRLNPRLVLLLYQIGPAEYNTAEWGRLGKGWDWIKANHGAGSAERWTALGVKYGEYLQSKPYPKERMMLPGVVGWQQFWLDSVEAAFWGDPKKPSAIADGVFSDNTRYAMVWKGHWRREGHPDTPDDPADYYRNGKPDLALYHQHMKSFFQRAFPWMAARGRKLALNFGDMARGPEAWAELDSEPHAPFAAMEEGAFVHPWGGKGAFVFYAEKEWLNQVESMRKLKHVRALMSVHGPVSSGSTDIVRMDSSDALGRRAWDVLWFALASFLQGYDDVRQNAYMNFTVWGYSKFHWLPEFDPQRLHLGRARADYRRLEGEAGHVYLREFEDGWAVVNPADKPATGVAVPEGEARLIDHDALESPESRPLVRRFDLAARGGVILLKPGHALGNADNPR